VRKERVREREVREKGLGRKRKRWKEMGGGA
jgi:hypothetical protein